MPAATNREELAKRTKREFARLTRALDRICETDAVTLNDGEVSIKDVVAHRGHWIGLFFKWIQTAQKGEPVQTPDDGYKWNQLAQYNAGLRKSQAGVGWVGARELLLEQHQRLMDFIQTTPDTVLYGPSPYAWTNTWTIGRWAEAAGASHYRSASKFVLARLREAEEPDGQEPRRVRRPARPVRIQESVRTHPG